MYYRMNPLFFLIVPILVSIILYKTAFKDGKPTCDHYVLNTYIYSVFYLGLMGFFISILLNHKDVYNKYVGLGSLIALVIAYIGLYFAVLFIPKEKVLLKHIVSIVYIFVASIFISSIFFIFFPESIMHSILMTFILFVILSGMAWKFQKLISSSISLPLLIVFLLLVVAEFVIGLLYPGTLIEKAIILIVLMVICYLVLVKTKRMIENSASCEKEGGPDYVKESMGFILSFQNLLLRILEIFGKRKRGIRM